MKPLPISWKLALWAAALVGVVLVIFAGGTFLNLFQEQIEAVDLELEAETRHVAALEPSRISDQTIDELLRFQPLLAIALFDSHGQLLRRSPSLPESLARAALLQPEIVTRRAPDGNYWRLKTLRRDATVFVFAHTLIEVHDIVRDLLFAYLALFPVVLVVSGLGGWWVAGRALAPLRALTRAAEGIQADHLDRRVPVSGADDEIRRLADVLNAMLARLEGSFQQTQRFAADASHELRTPLTIMQGEIEWLLRSDGLDRAHEEKLLSLQEEIGRLDRITEHLLMLARLDAGHVTLTRTILDLSALVTTACEDAELLADAREVKLTTAITPGLHVRGEEVHLRRLVLALLDNATHYNQVGGKVHCALAPMGDQAELRIRNTGPGIPESARAQLFQRFFRADPARSRGGHGLGLSLSREIARAHGGTVELNPKAEAGWTEFVVTLPLAPPPDPTPAPRGDDSERLKFA
jgi:heavy metal sensor kinase